MKIRRSVRLTPEEDKRADDARWKLHLSWQAFLLEAVELLVAKTRSTHGPKTLAQVYEDKNGGSDGG